MTYVYVIADHPEGGGSDAVATLDRARLPDLFRAVHANMTSDADRAWVDGALAGLNELLAQPDAELAGGGGSSLGRGWGGPLLYVIDLK